MMKKHLPGILLLMCVLFAGVSCSRDPAADNIPVLGATTAPSDTTAAPNPENGSKPTEFYPIIGKWYSESGATVIQFFSDNTLKFFSLKPGYYEYAKTDSGTYSYDGATLSYTLSDGDTSSFSCQTTETEMTLSSGSQVLTFQTTDTLPEKHPEYSFPDFEALAQIYALPTEALTGNTVPTDLRKQALESIRQQYWEGKTEDEMVISAESVAKMGDSVNIDYTGTLNGEPFSGGSATGVRIKISENSGYIPGFAEGIANHRVGETFDVQVTFPESYHSAELAGKVAVFQMKLNAIYDLTVTDEMAKEHEYESLEQWVTEVYEDLLRTNIWELIPGLSEAEVPADAYRFFYQYNLDYYHAYAFYYFGNRYETFLAYVGITEEQLLENCKEIAREYLQAAQIVRLYGLTPDEALIEKITAEHLASYIEAGYTTEEAEEILQNDGKTELRANLLTELAINYLITQNTFVPSDSV